MINTTPPLFTPLISRRHSSFEVLGDLVEEAGG
jgi:hypothetical protein